MSDPAPTADEAADRAVASAGRDLALLEEMLGIGAELMRSVAAQAESPDGRDPIERFAVITRTLRMTMAMKAKIHQALKSPPAGVSPGRKEERRRAAEPDGDDVEFDTTSLLDFVREHIRDQVIEAAEYEFERPESLAAFEVRLEAAMKDDPVLATKDLPIREYVEHLCHKTGLTKVDWSRWPEGGASWRRDDPSPPPAGNAPRYPPPLE